MASLVAGAKYRGEFEERLKNVLNEVKKSEGSIIMFIDEIHTIVGTGNMEGAMDTSKANASSWRNSCDWCNNFKRIS